jgi:hypothetical protein
MLPGVGVPDGVAVPVSVVLTLAVPVEAVVAEVDVVIVLTGCVDAESVVDVVVVTSGDVFVVVPLPFEPAPLSSRSRLRASVCSRSTAAALVAAVIESAESNRPPPQADSSAATAHIETVETNEPGMRRFPHAPEPRSARHLTMR